MGVWGGRWLSRNNGTYCWSHGASHAHLQGIHSAKWDTKLLLMVFLSDVSSSLPGCARMKLNLCFILESNVAVYSYIWFNWLRNPDGNHLCYLFSLLVYWLVFLYLNKYGSPWFCFKCSSSLLPRWHFLTSLRSGIPGLSMSYEK